MSTTRGHQVLAWELLGLAGSPLVSRPEPPIEKTGPVRRIRRLLARPLRRYRFVNVRALVASFRAGDVPLVGLCPKASPLPNDAPAGLRDWSLAGSRAPRSGVNGTVCLPTQQGSDLTAAERT